MDRTSRRNAGQRRWRSTGRGPVVVALASLLALAVLLTPASGGASGRPVAAVVEKTVHQTPAEVRRYWTARRMRAAEPVALQAMGARHPAAEPAAEPPGDPVISPPSSPGEGQTHAGLVAGRIGGGPATRAAAADQGADNTAHPARLHGKVFFTIEGGLDPGDFVCSGTVVSSPAHTLVWTAGHCVNDAEFGGGFATNWSFVPGYRNDQRPFGTWVASELFTTKGWRTDINLRVDAGAAVVARNGNGQGIEDVVGARGIAFNQGRDQQVKAFGYPALPNPVSLPPRVDYDGERLYACSSPISGEDNPPGSGPTTMEIECDMSQGSSGGGWVVDGSHVNGLVSYAHIDDGNHLYGPYFGSTLEDLYAEAGGAARRCAGVVATNVGTADANEFSGSAATDSFKLYGGADRAFGGDGDDFICGSGGDDERLAGERGADVIRGGRGDDLLVGGAGHDLCVGGSGNDRVRGCEESRRIP